MRQSDEGGKTLPKSACEVRVAGFLFAGVGGLFKPFARGCILFLNACLSLARRL
jgi:hypothetical protein